MSQLRRGRNGVLGLARGSVHVLIVVKISKRQQSRTLSARRVMVSVCPLATGARDEPAPAPANPSGIVEQSVAKFNLCHGPIGKLGHPGVVGDTVFQALSCPFGTWIIRIIARAWSGSESVGISKKYQPGSRLN